MKSGKPKIYVTRNAHGWEDGGAGFNYISEKNIEKLKEFAIPIIEDSRTNPVSEDALIQKLSGVRAILQLNGTGADEITERVLRTVGTVEVVSTAHSAWHCSLWDTAAKCGIKTTEGSNAIDKAVAEWTIGAAIMGRRNLIEAGQTLKAGYWQKNWRNASLLYGSKVGLIGLGRIGHIAARYFNALGADIIVYDKYFDQSKAADLGVTFVGLHELLQHADIVSLHLRVAAETTGILGAEEFAMIKDGCTFINSARAELYDSDAFVNELRKKRFQAFLDVYPDEQQMRVDGKVVREHPFFNAVHELDNVYMSSHISGQNDTMYELAGAETIETLRLYFSGEGLRDWRDL